MNDHYAFPESVDMWPYTEDGLAATERGPDPNRPAHSSAHHVYRLRGVVVQSGTEKSGHYYSYIQVH